MDPRFRGDDCGEVRVTYFLPNFLADFFFKHPLIVLLNSAIGCGQFFLKLWKFAIFKFSRLF